MGTIGAGVVNRASHERFGNGQRSGNVEKKMYLAIEHQEGGPELVRAFEELRRGNNRVGAVDPLEIAPLRRSVNECYLPANVNCRAKYAQRDLSLVADRN